MGYMRRPSHHLKGIKASPNQSQERVAHFRQPERRASYRMAGICKSGESRTAGVHRRDPVQAADDVAIHGLCSNW